jgi:hypothetical protein
MYLWSLRLDFAGAGERAVHFTHIRTWLLALYSGESLQGRLLYFDILMFGSF